MYVGIVESRSTDRFSKLWTSFLVEKTLKKRYWEKLLLARDRSTGIFRVKIFFPNPGQIVGGFGLWDSENLRSNLIEFQ